MKAWSIFSLLFLTLLVVCLTTANAKRKNDDNNDLSVRYDRSSLNKKNDKHEYKKYSKEFSDESLQSQKQKSKGRSKKKLVLDLDNVNEDELTSDELQVLEYRRKKLERQNKKTLGDVFQEKKQKNIQRKKKFEKNVLKHFKTDDDNGDVISSEEVITPLKRAKSIVEDECDSSEEKCH